MRIKEDMTTFAANGFSSSAKSGRHSGAQECVKSSCNVLHNNSEKPQITTITSFTLPDHILDSSLYVFPHFLTIHSEDSPFVRPHIDGKGETPNNSYSTNTEKRGNGMKRSDYDPRQVEWRNAPMQRSMSAAYLFYFVKKEKIRSVGGEMSSNPFSLFTLFLFFFMGNDQQHPDAIEATIK